MTKEQIYKEQMQALGIYEEAFDPEIKTLAQLERRLTRAQKAWAKTAPPGGKPSFLDDHYPVIVQLEDKILAHREALGLTPKSLRRLVGVAGSDAPQQQDLITAKLDQIAARVAGYDGATEIPANATGIPANATEIPANATGIPANATGIPANATGIQTDPFGDLPEAQEAAAFSEHLDEELRKAIAEDMG